MSQFRFLLFNAENLFLYLDEPKPDSLENLSEQEWQKSSISMNPNKSLIKCRGVAECIRLEDPDFVLFNEVGGLESLENFNRYFLNSDYDCHLIEGNSDRGIDVGYLTHKRVSASFLLLSHKSRPIDLNYGFPHQEEKTYFFSRDVAELRVYKKGTEQVMFVCLLTHLKSKLDPDGIDPQGRIRRTAEVKALVEIYQNVLSELGEDVKVVLAGDFNGITYGPNAEPEYESLNQSGLIDVFSHFGFDLEQRSTQTQFLGNTRKLMQFDYFYVSKNLLGKLNRENCRVHRFVDHLGSEKPLPSSYDQRLELPSDHYPVVLEFKI